MAYNPFNNIYIRLQFAQGHTVVWAIDPLFDDNEPHNFVLEVSGTVDFNELLREIPVGNSFYGQDLPNAQQTAAAVLYYRARLETPKNTYYSQSVSSYATPLTRRQFIIANEIVRKEMLRMRKFTGAPAVILKRKTYGTSVKDNLKVDLITGISLTDNSPDHGSPIANGYYAPVSTIFSEEQADVTMKLDPGGAGTIDRTDTTVRMPGFPLVHYNDILIDVDQDYRYIVKDRQEISFPGTSVVVSQILQVALIPPSDPVYSITFPR